MLSAADDKSAAGTAPGGHSVSFTTPEVMPIDSPREEPAELPLSTPATTPGNHSLVPVKKITNNSLTIDTAGSGDSALEPTASPAPVRSAHDPTPRLCSATVLLIALPNILLPCLYGYNIGLVGVYTTIYELATNCELYTQQTPCETLAGAKCKWGLVTNLNGTSVTQCSWRDRDTCSLLYSTEGTCNANSVCTWDYSGKTCGNKVGYTSIKSGLFAGAMIIGAMVGSFLGGVLTKKLNYRMSFLIVGIVATVASVLTHVATGIFQYWLLFVARIILGFPMGWQAVIAPGYVAVFSPKKLEKTLGTLFQVLVCFGIFLAAFFGITLGQTIKYSENADANLQGRMQGLVCFPTLLSLVSCGLYFVCKDVPAQQSDLDATDGTNSSKQGAPKQAKKATYSTAQMIGPLFIGFCMACTLQLTGVNAVMNFAPSIMSNLGLAPLVGNIVIMAWNAVAGMGVIPLSRYFSMRTLFITCTAIGSLACLFLCGIPLYPGVTPSNSASQGLAITGIFVFIGVYEAGIGPTFYVLAGDVFPSSFRHIGASVTVATQFIFNVIINICYPIATEGISGGPGGNQDKGQSIAFIFFGCIGIVTVAVEYFFLHPWSDTGSQEVAGVPDDLDGGNSLSA